MYMTYLLMAAKHMEIMNAPWFYLCLPLCPIPFSITALVVVIASW